MDSPLKTALDRFRIPELWQMLGLAGEPATACRSPFREDHNPSFSVYDDGRKWKDFGTGEGGDAVDFVALALNLTLKDACREFIGLSGGLVRSDDFKVKESQSRDQIEVERKARQRADWPRFDLPSQEEIGLIAALRGLSPEGVALAAERGLLFTTESREGRAWIVTDSRRKNAQARRLDGERWEGKAGAKAWTLPGSTAALPIGLREAEAFPNIALVEGGPDMLAAFHLALCAGVEGCIAPVAVLGAGVSLPKDALRYFAGKRVRIFEHNDEAGRTASQKWAACLSRAGAEVDGFSFSGLARFDGAPVKDLNDFACIDPDEWEAKWDIIEGAFAFAPETAKEASSNGSNAERRAA